MKEYLFEVNTIEAGQRKSYGDSFYHYEVTSNLNEYQVKLFCTKFLKPSYEKKDMPDPFSGELLEFSKITNNNEGKNIFDKREKESYRYKVRTEYTG